jgi:hypothetical protein
VNLVRKELFRCLLAFMRTSTLQDQIAAQNAKAIYALGRYLTLMNLEEVQREVGKVSPPIYGVIGK